MSYTAIDGDISDFIDSVIDGTDRSAPMNFAAIYSMRAIPLSRPSPR
jgi:hypothetical protein